MKPGQTYNQLKSEKLKQGPTGTIYPESHKPGVHRGSSMIHRPGGGVMVLTGSHLETDGSEFRFKSKEHAVKFLDSLKIRPKKDRGPF